MPMDDLKEQLLQAICENPDDDAPRLVYADYLLSQLDGESQLRGKLISYLCGPQPTDGLVLSRMRRKLERLKNHFYDWSKRDLGFTLDKNGAKSLEYDRGFLSYLHVSHVHWQQHRERLVGLRPPLTGMSVGLGGRLPEEDLRFLAGLRRLSVPEVPWVNNPEENLLLQVLTRIPEASWEKLSIYRSRVWVLKSLPLPRMPWLRHLEFCVVGRHPLLYCPPGLLALGLETIALTRVALTLELIMKLPGRFYSLSLSDSYPDEDLIGWLAREPLLGAGREVVAKNVKTAPVLALGWWLLDNFPTLKSLSWFIPNLSITALQAHPRVASNEVVLRGFFR